MLNLEYISIKILPIAQKREVTMKIFAVLFWRLVVFCPFSDAK